MEIDGVVIYAELGTILTELKTQLTLNGIEYFYKMGRFDVGKDIQVCCPYHKGGQERRPSAGIRKSDGLFHCFACGETHSLQEVVSHCFGHDDNGVFGWSWLMKNFATVERGQRRNVSLDFERKLTDRTGNSPDGNNSVVYISEEELDKYRYIHPYMYKRGLTDDVIELFDIGYDKNTRCITFPVRDINGKTLFIARRSVVSKFFNYPQGVEKPLYGLYELNAVKMINGHPVHILQNFPKEIIVCESMLDALSFWTVGKYAVALNGLGNNLQFKQLRELPCRKLILATDMDERGLAARERIRKNIGSYKIMTEYYFPEGRKDANDCTKEELKNLQEIF